MAKKPRKKLVAARISQMNAAHDAANRVYRFLIGRDESLDGMQVEHPTQPQEKDPLPTQPPVGSARPVEPGPVYFRQPTDTGGMGWYRDEDGELCFGDRPDTSGEPKPVSKVTVEPENIVRHINLSDEGVIHKRQPELRECAFCGEKVEKLKYSIHITRHRNQCPLCSKIQPDNQLVKHLLTFHQLLALRDGQIFYETGWKEKDLFACGLCGQKLSFRNYSAHFEHSHSKKDSPTKNDARSAGPGKQVAQIPTASVQKPILTAKNTAGERSEGQSGLPNRNTNRPPVQRSANNYATCPYCGQEMLKSSFNLHLSYEHPTCEVCNQRFNRTELGEHQRIRHPDSRKSR